MVGGPTVVTAGSGGAIPLPGLPTGMRGPGRFARWWGGVRSTKDRARAFRSHSGAHLEIATGARRRALNPPARDLLRTLKGGFGVRYTEEIVEHNIVSYLTIFGTVAGWVLIAA